MTKYHQGAEGRGGEGRRIAPPFFPLFVSHTHFAGRETGRVRQGGPRRCVTLPMGTGEGGGWRGMSS